MIDIYSFQDKHLLSNGVEQTLGPQSGEGQGAPQARSLSLQEPQETTATPTATITQSTVTLSNQPGKGRQANPDIQDIITGIVKLLNGNVNVQANTQPAMGRPLRPLSTRINNRGPPRITDVPALPPDFDVPAPLPPPPLGQMPPPVTSTRIPTPYPFDVPPSNISPVKPFGNPIPLSEQGSGNRPGFYRPVTIPPWTRPRRPPTRRPAIPPYKPMPPIPSDFISLTSEKPVDDILTLDLGSQLQSTSQETLDNKNITVTEEQEVTTDLPEEIDMPVEEIDNETAAFERNKEKSSSKMDKHTSKTTTVISTSTTESSTDLEMSTTQTLSELLAPTSVLTDMQTTSLARNSENITEINVTKTTEEPMFLESSIEDVLHTLKHDLLANMSSDTPTEELPLVTSTTEGIRSTESTISKTSMQLSKLLVLMFSNIITNILYSR